MSQKFINTEDMYKDKSKKKLFGDEFCEKLKYPNKHIENIFGA